jgi:hypothetical protein
MTTSTDSLHPLAADYLRRLRRCGRALPRQRLSELLAEIETHLSEAIDPRASDAEALTVLERLGEPDEIVAAELPQSAAPADRRGTREWAAIWLLLFGGFLFVFGWVAGLILLWNSRAWTTRDKLIGTLVTPGGLAAALSALAFPLHTTGRACHGNATGPTICTGGSTPGTSVLQIALLVILVVAPIITAIYLAKRAR